MTALRPQDGVEAVAAESQTYPSNRTCAHPECSEKVQLRPDGTPTVHHCWPRGTLHSDSYFVQLFEVGKKYNARALPAPIPHAVGLCGSGTTGHHGDVEEHRAWIKYEDGVWRWWARIGQELDHDRPPTADHWTLIGDLNPQPGSVEAKPKRRKFAGEAKRKRGNWQISVPKDHEDGAGQLDDLIEQLREHSEIRELYPDEGVQPFFIVRAALHLAMVS